MKDAQAYFTRAEQYADSTIVAALNADYYNGHRAANRGPDY